MSGLWSAVAAGIVVAMWLVFEFLRPRRRQAVARDQTNVALYEQRRQELEAEGARQGVDLAELEALERELDLALVDEFPAADAPADAASGSTIGGGIPRAMAYVMAAAVFLGSIGLYTIWGEPNAQALLETGATIAGDADDAALERAAQTLTKRVQRHPADQQSWFYLGHIRYRQGDYMAAAGAFSTVHGIAGASAEVDGYWAQSRYLAAGAEIDATTKEIIDRVLAQHRNHPAMLEMLAMDSIRRGMLDQAAAYLERVLGGALRAQRRSVLQGVLAHVRDRLDPARPHITVDVQLADDVTHPPWLMVFARPVGGGPPRAVVRRPASGRQTIVLDDAASMSPELGLSTAGDVVVVARLSSSGTAAAAPGDWQVASDPVNAKERPEVVLELQPPVLTERSVSPGHPLVAPRPAAAARLTIDVELGADVEIPDDTTVFVIARVPAAAGPPLAVKRLQVRDLPQTITLSDADAMLPGRGISSQSSVEVVARAALGGSAAAAAGDFESTAQVVSDLTDGLHLVIDQRVGG